MVELFQTPTLAIGYIAITALLVKVCLKQKRYRYLACVLMSMLFLMSWQQLVDDTALLWILASITAVTFVNLTELIPVIQPSSPKKVRQAKVSDYVHGPLGNEQEEHSEEVYVLDAENIDNGSELNLSKA